MYMIHYGPHKPFSPNHIIIVWQPDNKFCWFLFKVSIILFAHIPEVDLMRYFKISKGIELVMAQQIIRKHLQLSRYRKASRSPISKWMIHLS